VKNITLLSPAFNVLSREAEDVWWWKISKGRKKEKNKAIVWNEERWLVSYSWQMKPHCQILRGWG